MGLTQNLGLLSTAIKATSTLNVGIGTSSPVATLSMPLSTTNSQLSTGSIEIQSYAVNNSWIGDNIYYDGSGMKARSTGYTHQIYFGTTDGIKFYTGASSVTAGGLANAAEKMRITSGGTVCVNSTSGYSSEKMRIAVAGSGYCLQLSDTTNTSWQVLQGFNASGGDLGSIQRNGGSLAVLYNTSSDIRLKENILDAESALDRISKIKVRQFDWIGCNMHQEYGFIAQELNEVYPEVVNSQSKTWGVDYGKLTPILLKAIQELKAEIDQLKAK